MDIKDRRIAAYLGVLFLMVGATFISMVDIMFAFRVGNVFAIVFSIAVVIAFGNPALSLFAKGDARAENLLAAGLCLENLGTTIRSLMLYVWREYGEPPDLVNSPVFAMVPWVFVLAGFYQLSSSGIIDGKFPPKSVHWLVRIFFFAELATLIMMIFADRYLIDFVRWAGWVN